MNLSDFIIEAVEINYFTFGKGEDFFGVPPRLTEKYGWKNQEKMMDLMLDVEAAQRFMRLDTLDQAEQNKEHFFWLKSPKTPLFWASGFIRSVNIDHKEWRILIWKNLHEDGHILQQFLNAFPDILFVKDLKRRHVMINDNTAQAIIVDSPWLKPEDIVGKTDEQLKHLISDSPCEKKAKNEDMAVLNGERIYNLVSEVYGNFYSSSKSPLYDNEGHVFGLVGMVKKITEDTKIAQSEKRLKSLVEKSSAGMFIMNGFKLDYVNQAFCDLFGYSRREIIENMSFLDLVDEHDINRVRESIQLRYDGRVKGIRQRFNAKHKNGSKLYIESLGTVHQFSQKKILMGTVLDLTERMLMEKQCLDAQKMDSIGKVAGGICHDFNNILSIIHGNLSLAQMETGISKEMNQLVEQSLQATNRAIKLSRQLLTLSRKQAPDYKVIHLNKLIQSWLDIFKSAIPENVQLTHSFCQDATPVEVDGGMIEQVLMNLLWNAKDAMPQGGKIELFTDCIQLREIIPGHPVAVPEGDYVMITIKDNGSGMSPETMAKIFDPFFSTKEIGKGTGLGLAVVQNVLRQHYSYIQVTSEINKGTAFTIYIPRSAEVHPTDTQLVKVKNRSKSLNIAIVEDDSNMRVMLGRLLNAMGHTIYSFEDEHAALKFVESQHHLDVLITDVVLTTTLTGYDIGMTYAQRWPEIHIVLMSGYSFGMQLPQTTHNQWRFLPKPFTADKVEELIASLLR